MSGIRVCDFCFRAPSGGIVWHSAGILSDGVRLKHACCPRCIPQAPQRVQDDWFKQMGDTARKLAEHFRAIGVWR